MKKSMILLFVLTLVYSTENNQDKPTRIIENSERIILVNPEVEKEIIKKENAVLLLENSNEQNNESEASDSEDASAKKAPNKEIAIPLDYNLQPVENASGTVESNSQIGKKKHNDLMNGKDHSLNKKLRMEASSNLEKEALKERTENERAEYLNEKVQASDKMNALKSAKESAVSLEYNLQSVQNTEGTIKDENSGGKFPFISPKLKDYIDQGLGRAENNIIIDSPSNDSRDGSVTLTGADAWGDGWNGNELCVNGACYAVEGYSGSWDLGVLASGDYAVSCGGGNYGSEVSWAFHDAAGNTLLSGSVGDYTLTVGDSGCTDADAHSLSVGGGSWGSEVGWSIAGTSYSGSVGDFSLCLADGGYTFDMTDSYGDGWNGNTATITDSNGDVVASGGITEASDAGSFDFSLGGPPPVSGCTDPNSSNYNADADIDDGSCASYCGSVLYGCGYYLDVDYDCETLTGWGYDCTDCYAEGACPVLGCTDETADNYNDGATTDDGSCTYPCDGLFVNMVDSYGDGWNGNILTIGNELWQSFTIESGSAGQGCYTGATENVAVSCGGGSYMGEVSWDISDADGNVLLSGGAPYDGVLNPSAPPTCDDESACNNGAEGDCEYATSGYNCDGSCAEGYENDCSGACASSSTIAGWQGDGYCDDGAWGLYLDCCDFNFDDGDCGNEIGCDGVATECGGAVNDDCGECGGDNSSCADCAGVANGDCMG